MSKPKPTYCTNQSAEHCAACELSSYGRDCQNSPIDRPISHQSPIERMRKEIGMSRAELARRSGVSLVALEKYDNGELKTTKMSLQIAIDISNALGVDICDFVKAVI